MAKQHTAFEHADAATYAAGHQVMAGHALKHCRYVRRGLTDICRRAIDRPLIRGHYVHGSFTVRVPSRGV
jgi:hypothetical protein